MKRELVFRGFDGTNWYYGDLEYNRTQNVARIHAYKEDGGYDGQFIVDPDTVGQFTGMCDKIGVRVFEGDVVEVYDFTSDYPTKYQGVVKMYRGSWCVEHEDFIFETIFRPKLIFDDFADKKTKVVGNIHEK